MADRSMTYAMLAAYLIVAGWVFWPGPRNGVTTAQSLIVSLFWPVVLVFLLVLLL